MDITEVFREAQDLGARQIRTWPAGPGQLAVVLTAASQAAESTLAGQYFVEVGAAEATARSTPGSYRLGRFVLQPDGVDGRLVSLQQRVTLPSMELISHRVNRRAVLVQRGAMTGADTFTKVVPKSKVAKLFATASAAQRLPVQTPTVISHDRDSVTISGLPGESLYHLLATAGEVELTNAVFRVGRALARLHRAPVPAGTPIHDGAAEFSVMQSWQALAANWAAAPARPPKGACPGASDWDGPSPKSGGGPPVLLHRDLHDKQVLIDGSGIGFIDFDLLSAGDAALDLGNLIEHFTLRQRQARTTIADRLVEALLTGYQPSDQVLSDLPWYRKVARERLRSVYHFRSDLG